MRQGLWVLGLACAAAAASSSVEAQVTSQAMVAGRQVRTVKVRAGAQAEFDTNIAKTSEAQAVIQGLTLEDVTYTPSLNVNFVVPLGRQAVFMQGAASYLFHQNNKRLDHDSFNVAGGVGNSLGPCGTVLTGAYQRGRSQLSDRALVLDVQSITETKSATFGLTCSRPSGLGIVANGMLQRGSNSGSTVAIREFETESLSGGLSYGRPSSGSISVQGNYGRTKYPQQVGAMAQGLGYETKGVSVHVERRVGARIQLGGTFGYVEAMSLAPPPVTVPTMPSRFKGINYLGDASYRASSRLQASATFSRQISPSLIAGRSFEVQSAYSLGVDYKIGSRISTRLAAQQTESTSRGGSPATATTLTASKVKTVLASIRYRQSDRLSFVLNAAHEQRTANDPRFAYTGDRVGLTADVSF